MFRAVWTTLGYSWKEGLLRTAICTIVLICDTPVARARDFATTISERAPGSVIYHMVRSGSLCRLRGTGGVIFRNADADALRRACLFFRWEVVSDTFPQERSHF